MKLMLALLICAGLVGCGRPTRDQILLERWAVCGCTTIGLDGTGCLDKMKASGESDLVHLAALCPADQAKNIADTFASEK